MQIENLILKSLLLNENYFRATLPYLKSEYFSDFTHKTLFKQISNFIGTYNEAPTIEALRVILSDSSLKEEEIRSTTEVLDDYVEGEENNLEWLISKTEDFCKEQAIHNAVLESIHIISDKKEKKDKGIIPDLLKEALAVSFDPTVGHDFIEDYEARYDFYHRKEEKIPFDISQLNDITKGGLPKKTLNVILAGCVHPDTKVKIRFRYLYKNMHNYTKWEEKIVNISEISELLEDYEVLVDSPDGWVPVNSYVDKGIWEEYVLYVEGKPTVRCNENHLFETDNGWKLAKEWNNPKFKTLSPQEFPVLTDDGKFKLGSVVKTGKYIPIVDIQVDHPNHRYYTNGISSHNTNVGKSLAMCHFATSNLVQGKNVLYITLEMAEEKIAERIDANILDISLENLHLISKEQYVKLISSAQKRVAGKLIVKEYPTSSANVNHFRHLLNELALKKKFVPDIIYIDYLNICSSSRVKFSPQVNTYVMIKSIAEEIRGLAVEFGVPVVTATQTNRTGFSSSDVELTDTSESFGLPATADFMFALINTDELEKLSQLMVKQLKNRYNDVSMNKKFFVGVDRSKMRLYEIAGSADESFGSTVDDSSFDTTGYSGKPDLKAKFNSFKF